MSVLRILPTLALGLLLLAAAGCDSIESPSSDSVPAAAARPGPVPAPSAEGCVTGRQSSGALYEICVPEGDASRTLVIYARGFVFPQAPLALPTSEGGVNVRQFVLDQGFTYAATSYASNGVIVPQAGVKDLRELITLYRRLFGQPDQVLLLGFSNGALVSLHALEQNPGLFDGALASCGPVGGYTAQVDYLADIFVLFQHFFPGALDGLFGVPVGGPEGINPAFLARLQQAAAAMGVSPRDFLAGYLQGVLGNPANLPQTAQLLSVIAQTPSIRVAYANATEGSIAVISAVVYTVFVTNQAIEVFGGRAYDNVGRRYVGSANDAALNAAIARYRADNRARTQLRVRFEVDGQLRAPVVALHTTRDPLVPFWQQALFVNRVRDASLYTIVPVERFGHCAFTRQELQDGLDLLLEQVATRMQPA
jgi:pimeloyl-ACP methyl ester carboxylesterase